jgi:peroxiredoxin
MNEDMTLSDQISKFTAAMAERAPREVLATLEAELEKLVASGIAQRALHVGARAPDFSLPEARGATIESSTLLARGPVVVSFYRGSWCPFCDLQLRAYQLVLPEIHRLGAELVAISPQTPDYALIEVERKELAFPVLSDAGNQVARRYGLVFKLSEALQRFQIGVGNPLPKFNGDESWETPMPGTFVLDRSGVVRLAHVDANYRVRLEPTELLTALREIAG